MSDNPEWFAEKRSGYGSGLPITWQGWALSAAFAVMIFAAWYILGHNVVAFLSVLVPVSVIFVIICARTTRGGWHWRRGKGD